MLKKYATLLYIVPVPCCWESVFKVSVFLTSDELANGSCLRGAPARKSSPARWIGRGQNGQLEGVIFTIKTLIRFGMTFTIICGFSNIS